MSHSEQMIENQFIQILSEKENQWTYRPDLKSEETLWQNFRGHLNRINLAVLEEQLLTDKEFKQVKVEFSRLINNDIFRQDVMKYLEIETDKNFEITESEDFNEDNDFLKLFI